MRALVFDNIQFGRDIKVWRKLLNNYMIEFDFGRPPGARRPTP